MALPDIALPSNSYTLPGSGTKISMRPLTGQEFELMLVAKESKDKKDHLDAIYKLLDAVVSEPPTFNSSELSPLDFDFVFTKMMITSYGKQTIDFSFLCKNKVTGKDGKEKNCNSEVPVKVDLQKDVVFENPEKTVKNEVAIDDQHKLVLQPVKTEHVLMMQQNVYEMAQSLIDKIVNVDTGEEWKFTGDNPDVTEEEARSFAMNKLGGPVMKKIGEYYSSEGRMTTTINPTCTSCGYEHSVTMNGFFDFFGHASLPTV